MMPSPMLYRLLMAALAVSGVAQMPIFKRYGISSVPGLSWTADYAFTHHMHYVAAAGLLFLLGYALASRGAAALGRARLVMLGVLAATGAVRMLKNLPDVSFSPQSTMLVDWTHLGAAMAMGLGALALALSRRKPKTIRR
uniref:FeS-binding protein n=1 Tax=Fundidesulfovibrio putealis TaxID=270496 RepID=A0A7C4AI79_9BACT